MYENRFNWANRPSVPLVILERQTQSDVWGVCGHSNSSTSDDIVDSSTKTTELGTGGARLAQIKKRGSDLISVISRHNHFSFNEQLLYQPNTHAELLLIIFFVLLVGCVRSSRNLLRALADPLLTQTYTHIEHAEESEESRELTTIPWLWQKWYFVSRFLWWSTLDTSIYIYSREFVDQSRESPKQCCHFHSHSVRCVWVW